jgi:hypothetical protein
MYKLISKVFISIVLLFIHININCQDKQRETSNHDVKMPDSLGSFHVITQYDTIFLRSDTVRLEEHINSNTDEINTIRFDVYVYPYVNNSLIIFNESGQYSNDNIQIRLKQYHTVNLAASIAFSLKTYNLSLFIGPGTILENYSADFIKSSVSSQGYDLLPIDTFYYDYPINSEAVIVYDTIWHHNKIKDPVNVNISSRYSYLFFGIGMGKKFSSRKFYTNINTGLNCRIIISSPDHLYPDLSDVEISLMPSKVDRFVVIPFADILTGYSLSKRLNLYAGIAFNFYFSKPDAWVVPISGRSLNASYNIGLSCRL